MASSVLPKTPKPLITESPRALSTSQSATPSKGLNILLQNAAANVSTASPISAIFLVQFDVKSGYVLKWSKTINDKIPLKGVEFKSLPSGLHEVERDIISFVQIQDNDDESETGESQPFDNSLYGVSVFHQNLKESAGGSRNKVKMFSLGILVDPLSHQINNKSIVSKFSGDLPTWKPMYFTSGLEYVDQLHKLLDEWDNSTEDYTEFEDFFEKHSPKINLLDALSAKSPRSPSGPKIHTQTLHSSLTGKHHSHHFLLNISNLLEALGPLIFRVWRSALLREKILLFDAPSVELTCAFTYCLAILSTIPQEIHWLLNESGCWATSALQFIQPIYSIGVNDIDWLKTLATFSGNKNTSFIASSTDEILLFKSALYDISVQFNQPHHVHTKVPKVFPSEASLPGSKNTDPLRATQRDLKRFKILAREFNLYSDGSSLGSDVDSTITNSSKLDDADQHVVPDRCTKSQQEAEGLPWWTEVTDPASLRQLAWSGFYWWASAGENEKIEEEQELEGLVIGDGDEDQNKNAIERSLILVGYFQNMTKRLFTTIADIINNENEDSKNNVSNDDDDNDDELVDEKIIWIEPADIFEMGLDPYSKQDAEFIVKLIQVWWGRKAQVGSKISNLCCF